MAWGISGSLGTEIRKQQSDDLKDQLLQQQMAQRIKEFEQEQQLRREDMQMRRDAAAQQARERAEDVADRTQQRAGEAARYLHGVSQPGVQTPEAASVLRKYPGTASLLRTQTPLAAMAGPGSLSREDTSGPQQFDVLEPTEEQAEKAGVKASKAQLVKVLGGLGQTNAPQRRAELLSKMAELDPVGAAKLGAEPTEAERTAAHRGDLLFQESLIRGRPREPREPRQVDYEWVIRDGEPVRVPKDQPSAPGDKPLSYGAKKPATGQARRQLDFFISGKQGDEEMEKVEEQIANLGMGGQMRLNAPHWLNFLQSTEGQAFNQAQQNFVLALTTGRSGAQVRPDEYDRFNRAFFVQPGDDKPLIAQKRRARAAVLSGLQAQAGTALDEHYGEDEAEELRNLYRTRAAGKEGTQPRDGGGVKVRMRAPNGQEQDVDPSQIEHFKSLGAKVVGGAQ